MRLFELFENTPAQPVPFKMNLAMDELKKKLSTFKAKPGSDMVSFPSKDAQFKYTLKIRQAKPADLAQPNPATKRDLLKDPTLK